MQCCPPNSRACRCAGQPVSRPRIASAHIEQLVARAYRRGEGTHGCMSESAGALGHAEGPPPSYSCRTRARTSSGAAQKARMRSGTLRSHCSATVACSRARRRQCPHLVCSQSFVAVHRSSRATPLRARANACGARPRGGCECWVRTFAASAAALAEGSVVKKGRSLSTTAPAGSRSVARTARPYCGCTNTSAPRSAAFGAIERRGADALRRG